MPAIICDIPQDILGADFTDKYKLGFEWDDFNQTELYITDKKAQSKTLLQMVTVPSDLQRISFVNRENLPLLAEQVQVPKQWLKAAPKPKPVNPVTPFEVACMKKLDEFGQEKIVKKSP